MLSFSTNQQKTLKKTTFYYTSKHHVDNMAEG